MDFIIITNNNKVYNFYKETNDIFLFSKKRFSRSFRDSERRNL